MTQEALNQTMNSTTETPPEEAAIAELTELFAAGDDDLDGGAGLLSSEPPSSTSPAAPTPSGESATPPEPPTTTAVEPPAASTAAPAATPAAASPTTPSVPEPTPAPPSAEEMAKQMEELAKLYQISDEDALLFQTEPEKALPKLAAKLQMTLTQDFLRVLPVVVPQLVEQQTQQARLEQEAQDMFFKAWPALREHKADVLRVGKAYRAANPQATPEQVIAEVGAIVASSLKIPINQVQAAPTTPPAPSTPKPPSFRPAGAGGSRGATPMPSEWEELLSE